MDRPGVRQVPEGSGEQGKMEKTGYKIICGAPTTLAVKELMMMMMKPTKVFEYGATCTAIETSAAKTEACESNENTNLIHRQPSPVNLQTPAVSFAFNGSKSNETCISTGKINAE